MAKIVPRCRIEWRERNWKKYKCYTGYVGILKVASISQVQGTRWQIKILGYWYNSYATPEEAKLAAESQFVDHLNSLVKIQGEPAMTERERIEKRIEELEITCDALREDWKLLYNDGYFGVAESASNRINDIESELASLRSQLRELDSKKQ